MKYLQQPKNLAMIGGTVGTTVGLIYAYRLLFRQLERYLNRPKLVRDTSHRGLFRKRLVVGPQFSDMILPELEEELSLLKIVQFRLTYMVLICQMLDCMVLLELVKQCLLKRWQMSLV